MSRPASRLLSRSLLPISALALLLGACAHGPVATRERTHLELRYTNASRQLATSLYAMAFFRDASRRLLAEEPPEEVVLLATPRGQTIPPGELQEILPAGTRVTVLRILFPSGWSAVQRPLLTPTDRIWVELAVEGRPVPPAFVLVLPPDATTEAAVVAEIDRLLSTDKLAQEIAGLSETDRAVIATKTLREGATLRALELAFRKPNLRKIHGDGTTVVEEWTWRGATGHRTAFLRDGVVERIATTAPSDAP